MKLSKWLTLAVKTLSSQPKCCCKTRFDTLSLYCLLHLSMLTWIRVLTPKGHFLQSLTPCSRPINQVLAFECLTAAPSFVRIATIFRKCCSLDAICADTWFWFGVFFHDGVPSSKSSRGWRTYISSVDPLRGGAGVEKQWLSQTHSELHCANERAQGKAPAAHSIILASIFSITASF